MVRYSTEFFTFYQLKFTWITSYENQRLNLGLHHSYMYISEKMQSNFQRFGKLGWFDSFGLAEIKQFLFSAYNQLCNDLLITRLIEQSHSHIKMCL